MTTTGNALSERKYEFAWSWSRHDMFYQCPRKIYWQYYGSRNGKDPQAPPDARLSFRLKHIRGVGMLVGGTLHEVVRERLHLRPERGGPVPAQQIQDEVERRVLKRLRESRNRDWERFADPQHYAILFEDYYGTGVDEREHKAALDLVGECAQGFAGSVYARRAFALPKSRLRIIDPIEFEDMKMEIDGILVYAAPDLVVEDKAGMLHVVDWKSGKTRKTDVAQLAVYGLYASQKLGAPLERIVAHIVYVRTGEREVHQHLLESVAEARRRVSTYTADVRSRLTDVANNIAGDIAQFPMTDNRMLCTRCKFQEICGRGSPSPVPPEDEEDF